MIRDNGLDVSMRLRERVESMDDLDDLSDQLAETIGGGMHDRSLEATAPDGTPWARNAPSTIARKGFDMPGIDSGEMLARDNFTTDYRAEKGIFTLSYSGPRELLGYFQGNNRYDIARIAWGMDPTIRDNVDAVLHAHFRSKLHRRR
jgi:hypothetical protein